MAERFYLNWPLTPGPVRLEGAEAHHLAAVCRLRPGDPVCLFNGDGNEYPGRILHVERRLVDVEVLEALSPPRELEFSLEVAAPLPKGDRAQFLIEKLTELGVTSFVPLATRRSVVHPGDAKLDKLKRYVIEASKQCGRNRLMDVGPLTSWESYAAKETLPRLRFLVHPQGDGNLGQLAQIENVALAVGPEGGFTDEEVTHATNNGWKVVSLGPRILRIETAAITLAAVYVSRSQGNRERGT